MAVEPFPPRFLTILLFSVLLLFLADHPPFSVLCHRLPIYKDPSQPVDVRVKDLISQMTLDEKIGQMMQIERSIANESVITQYFIGSVLSGGGSEPQSQATPTEWANMVDSFQQAALSTRLGIPMIYGIDAVHGHNNVYGATIFPHNIGLGCTRERDLVQRIGAATALEVRATGIPYVFAPCVAVCRHPFWGRCYESYSEDPDLVRNMTDIILGLQGQFSSPNYPNVATQENVVATAKHFVGDGGTVDGIDENNTICSYQQLVDIHMVPYFDAIAKGVSSIMISYSSWNGVKMHSNQYLITDILKGQLDFQGFVISDWEGIDRITSPPGSNYILSVNESINAGIDMVMLPYEFNSFLNDMTNELQAGTITIDRINDAVSRILTVKFIAGLFENPFTNRSLLGVVGSTPHRQLAREAVRKSLVLLQDGKTPGQPVLPLNKNASKILVAGSHADNLGYQCGGWTGDWQGYGGDNITNIGATILQAVTNTVGPSTEVVYQQAPTPATVAGNGFDYAIVAVGEKPYAEYFGDNTNLTIPEDGIQTIQNVCGSVTCIVVLISGRPLVIQPYLPLMDVLVAAWLPGAEGEGITDVLFGDFNFQGTLSRTWFKTVDQLPMNVGDPNYDPLFAYGFGLSMDISTNNVTTTPTSPPGAT